MSGAVLGQKKCVKTKEGGYRKRRNNKTALLGGAPGARGGAAIHGKNHSRRCLSTRCLRFVLRTSSFCSLRTKRLAACSRHCGGSRRRLGGRRASKGRRNHQCRPCVVVERWSRPETMWGRESGGGGALVLGMKGPKRQTKRWN